LEGYLSKCVGEDDSKIEKHKIINTGVCVFIYILHKFTILKIEQRNPYRKKLLKA